MATPISFFPRAYDDPELLARLLEQSQQPPQPHNRVLPDPHIPARVAELERQNGRPVPGLSSSASPQQPGLMDRMMNGLFGQQENYGGTLSDGDLKSARQRAVMSIAAGLLAGSGPSSTPRGTGELVGSAILSGQSTHDQAIQSALQMALLKGKMAQKDRGKLVPVLGDGGTVTYRYESDAEGMTPYLKPPSMGAPVAIIDDDGKIRYVAREDAIGKTPYSQPQTQVNVSTDKNLYGTLAEKQAAQYSDLYSQAQIAPERIIRAQRVKEVLNRGAFTGTAANFKLAFGKAARELGYDVGSEVENTEALAADLAASTLEAIKTSGLGGGSGFSNADRDFLERVTGGKITLEAQTLRKLADLNERSGRLTVQRWNSTAKRLKPELLDQLGMGLVEEVGNNMGNGWSIEPVR